MKFRISKQRKLEKHLQAMEWELKSRLNPDNKYGYMKGVKYFQKQIELTKKKLK
jgi:hypothetical protein